MPYTEVMHKFKHGELHSGSKSGKTVTNPKQAVAIMLSEKRSGEGMGGHRAAYVKRYKEKHGSHS